jgi:hypothetical protein
MKNPIESIEDKKTKLFNLLNNYNIPLYQWGTGDAKTIDHLLEEVTSGETVLVEDNDSKDLIREFSFLAIIVFCKYDGKKFKLIEEKQVFNDGRERVRKTGISVGEKIKQNDNDIEESIKRALQEELNIKEGFSIGKIEQVKENVYSSSYPGLKSRRIRFDTTVEIDVYQYNPKGYKEVQYDKTTYFVWEKVE